MRFLFITLGQLHVNFGTTAPPTSSMADRMAAISSVNAGHWTHTHRASEMLPPPTVLGMALQQRSLPLSLTTLHRVGALLPHLQQCEFTRAVRCKGTDDSSSNSCGTAEVTKGLPCASWRTWSLSS